MSMHEIEGLVEDAVQLVATSKMAASVKRDFLFNLYNFQARFDTGYTHFRHINTLLELKFTYRVPIEKHPDYKEHQNYFNLLDLEKNSWLPSKIGQESEWVYAKQEEDNAFIYVDAGSELWKLLCENNILPKQEHQSPKEFKTSWLIWKMLKEAQEQQNEQLLRDWYAFLINAYLDYSLEKDSGFFETFLEFSKQEEVQAIRKIGITSKPFAKKSNTDDWGYLAKPNLREIEEEERNIEHLFCVKYLLDFKSTEEIIKSAYFIAITPNPLREKKLQIIPNAVIQHLGTDKWKLVWESEYNDGYKWLYHHQLRGEAQSPKDTDLHTYLFLDANTEDLKMLYPKMGIQNGLLNRWQGRNAIHTPENIHFFETLASFIPTKEYDTNKSLHNMGGWKFNLKNSENTLKSHVTNFFDNFQKHGSKVFAEFEKPLFNDFKMTLDKALTYREEIQQTHRFFLNEIEVYLVYAIHHFEKGNREKAIKLAKQAKSMAQEKKHPIAKDWIATAQSVLDNKPKLNELLSFERKYSL